MVRVSGSGPLRRFFYRRALSAFVVQSGLLSRKKRYFVTLSRLASDINFRRAAEEKRGFVLLLYLSRDVKLEIFYSEQKLTRTKLQYYLIIQRLYVHVYNASEYILGSYSASVFI